MGFLAAFIDAVVGGGGLISLDGDTAYHSAWDEQAGFDDGSDCELYGLCPVGAG